MDSKDWIVLKTIAEVRSLTKAAERLYLSQPALTYRLRNLEKEFGVPILMRSPNGTQLTEQGEYILGYASDMLEKLKQTKEHVLDMSNQVQGVLRIASSTTFAQWELAPLLSDYKRRYPLVEVHLKTQLSSQLINLLREQAVHLAILRGDNHWNDCRHLLREEALCLVCAQPVALEDLPRMPWIQYEIDFTINATDEDWWREHFSVLPISTMKVDKIDTCLQMVLHGLGWTILPEIWLKSHPGLFRLPMFRKDGSPIKRRTWLLYRRESLGRTAVKAFIDQLLSDDKTVGQL
ncbi:MAG: LysR family transcriptional regulator [Sporomusaceae bacterium]|nr:LysR family transcriptional regulator [Sporomusaceae bacterium]